MFNPFYSLDDETQGIILAMVETCETKKLDNFSFSYAGYESVNFNLNHYRNDWELTVKQEKKLSETNYILFDVYTVSCGEIKYNYSEKDIA